MKVPPLKRFRDRPVALLYPGWRTITIETVDGSITTNGENNCYLLLSKYEGHVCYVMGNLTMLRHTTGATAWSASTWRGRAVRMDLAGTKVSVVSLRGCLDKAPDPFSSLNEAIGWLRDLRVSPGSLSSMAWNLWRGTLPAEISIHSDPRISRSALFGGRQWAREPKVYQHQASVDIKAAYAYSMGNRPYALSLRKVGASTSLDPTAAGLCEATVNVPNDTPHNPLPVRVARDMIQFPSGLVKGTWTWCELASAMSLGFEVEVHEVWAPVREMDLFGPWWQRVVLGRSLPGAAATMAKGLGNALWGLFGMQGDDKAVVRWTDDIGDDSIIIAIETRKLPHVTATHIAAETSSRVRSRMLLEGLYGPGASPIHVDTDGVIKRASDIGLPLGDQPGQWMIKDRMPKVDLRAPQVYRHTCGKGCGTSHAKWHYVAAGVPASSAPAMFDRVAAVGTTVAVRGMDAVLPQGHITDTGFLRDKMSEANAVRSEMYGQPLGNKGMLPRPTHRIGA